MLYHKSALYAGLCSILVVLLSLWPATPAVRAGVKNFRPPAVPLLTYDPYFNIWSCATHLAEHHTRDWANKSYCQMLWIGVIRRQFV